MTDAIQENNSEKQLTISLVREILLDMFDEKNKKTLERLKKHEENLKSIIIDCKISSINRRLDKLTLDTNNHLTITNEVRSKTNDLTLSLEATENKKLKEELKNLRSDLKEKDWQLKN